jgi:hypothetical protein
MLRLFALTAIIALAGCASQPFHLSCTDLEKFLDAVR